MRRGETLGLVGESGSGQSSVGRCFVGLAPFDSGRIVFDGKDLAQGGEIRAAVGGKIQRVFQDPYTSLNPRHEVGAAIAGGPIAQDVGKADATARTPALLELVGLGSDAADRYSHEFSGGRRQRIGIARALARRVADEPVSALDVSVQAQVLDCFEQVQRPFALAMVFIAHDLRVAGQTCDRIAVMQRGEVVQYGQTREVLNGPRHAGTRQLIHAVPRLAAPPSPLTLALR